MQAKQITYYNDRYQGSLTEEQCKKLEVLIQLDKENGVIKDLQHVIYHLSDEDVDHIIKTESAKGINEAVFDRNGYLYHGVVAAFAEALRENGIKL